MHTHWCITGVSFVSNLLERNLNHIHQKTEHISALYPDTLSHKPVLQFSSVAQSCLTLCDPMNRSTPTPGLPVQHQLPEFTRLTSIESVMPSSHLILCRPLLLLPLSLPPASESFPVSQLFAWGGQSTGVSALASFLPKNTQDQSPLEWTGWTSL